MDEEEIKSIMRQFKHGAADSEWKQFIKSIKITNIHGWTGQEIAFNFPVVAIVGENGIGKSTFLKASVCAYKNKNGQTFYPSKMFVSTRWDATGLQNATIEYKVRKGNEDINLRWKKTNDWGFTPKQGKPERNVFFLDISRTLPLDATAGYANGIKLIDCYGEKMPEKILLLVEDYIDGKLHVFDKDWPESPFAHREHIGCTVDYVSGRNRYMGYLISLGIYSFKGVKVGLDCANGASQNRAKSVFDAQGADTYVMTTPLEIYK